MKLTSIIQEKIDYAWTKPQTYLVLVPGLSLIIQKIQLAKVIPQLKKEEQHLDNPASLTKTEEITRNYRGIADKCSKICKWHSICPMIQIVASIVAIQAFSAPIFLLLLIPASYEMVDTLYKGLKTDIIVYKFDQNGTCSRGIGNALLS